MFFLLIAFLGCCIVKALEIGSGDFLQDMRGNCIHCDGHGCGKCHGGWMPMDLDDETD